MYDTALLRGTVAVVTGARHGLGRAYAHASADIGAGIVVDDIDDEAARIVVTEIEETRGRRCREQRGRVTRTV
jgi:NAD(P)-dependent dehydrogenase (short-subunit alcohol dehydrogenase family)